MKLLGTIRAEGFTCDIREFEDGRVEFVADADIDADGANGLNGGRAAYMRDNQGSEHLANGGMQMRGDRVVPLADWWKDIVLAGPDGYPMVLTNGVVPSKTSYHYPGKRPSDPAAYVDAETVPYIVVPPLIIARTAGAVLGCRAKATNLDNGMSCIGIVADVGPRNKVGELSIEMARQLGIPHNPRNGGTEKPRIQYELWPGLPGSVNGERIALLRSTGQFIV